MYLYIYREREMCIYMYIYIWRCPFLLRATFQWTLRKGKKMLKMFLKYLQYSGFAPYVSLRSCPSLVYHRKMLRIEPYVQEESQIQRHEMMFGTSGSYLPAEIWGLGFCPIHVVTWVSLSLYFCLPHYTTLRSAFAAHMCSTTQGTKLRLPGCRYS